MMKYHIVWYNFYNTNCISNFIYIQSSEFQSIFGHCSLVFLSLFQNSSDSIIEISQVLGICSIALFYYIYYTEILEISKVYFKNFKTFKETVQGFSCI